MRAKLFTSGKSRVDMGFGLNLVQIKILKFVDGAVKQSLIGEL